MCRGRTVWQCPCAHQPLALYLYLVDHKNVIDWHNTISWCRLEEGLIHQCSSRPRRAQVRSRSAETITAEAEHPSPAVTGLADSLNINRVLQHDGHTTGSCVTSPHRHYFVRALACFCQKMRNERMDRALPPPFATNGALRWAPT